MLEFKIEYKMFSETLLYHFITSSKFFINYAFVFVCNYLNVLLFVQIAHTEYEKCTDFLHVNL